MLGPAGGAGAGTASYPATLYLSASTSSLLSGSNTLVSSSLTQPAVAPGGAACTPTPCSGTPSLSATSYTYEYTLGDGSGETPPSPVKSVTTIPTPRWITLSALPTGVNVNVYRMKTGTMFTRVASLPSNASSTYVDNESDANALLDPVLPTQAQNQIPLNTTGYQDFAPRTANTGMSSVSTSPNGSGWIADGVGGVSFPTGSWMFQAKVKQSAPSGTADLVVGMWKVTVSGNAITGSTMLVDPTCSTAPCGSGAAPGENGTNFAQSPSGTTIQQTVSVNGFSLQSGEHLYVQYWRHQTSPEITGSAANATATMFTYDGTAEITHPAATATPDVPALVSPAAALRTNNTTPSLSASYFESDANAGTVTFNVCSDVNRSTILQSHTTGALSSGTNGSWTPAALADGTYYWQAQATDSSDGSSSAASATQSLVIDTVPPGTPTFGAPANSARVNSATLHATFVDSDATDSGTVDFQLCSNASCSSVVASSTRPSWPAVPP